MQSPGREGARSGEGAVRESVILRARTVVPMVGAPIDNGAVVVEGDCIMAVGGVADVNGSGPVLDLGEQVLMPGLINAHCHLDYTMMRHALSPPASFTAWVQRINALKRSLDTDDYLTAIARGFKELQHYGTTTVCNVEAFPELMPRVPPSPLRTWWFYEMIDIRHRITSEDVVAGALTFFQQRNDSRGGFGLSPHAPYTASRVLYRLANDCAEKMDMLLTTHLAESREEMAMFKDGSGPLYDFMRSLQRPLRDCGTASPFAGLWKSGAINGQWILVHMNELIEEDFELLASIPSESRPHIVHCPGSHRYFRHSPFCWPRFRDLDMNVCLGTDSLASTDSLGLFGEMRRFRESQPDVSPEEVLRMVTVNPARALQRTGRLGGIVRGAVADLIALPNSSTVPSVHEEIVEYERPISWMMIDGQICS